MTSPLTGLPFATQAFLGLRTLPCLVEEISRFLTVAEGLAETVIEILNTSNDLAFTMHFLEINWILQIWMAQIGKV